MVRVIFHVHKFSLLSSCPAKYDPGRLSPSKMILRRHKSRLYIISCRSINNDLDFKDSSHRPQNYRDALLYRRFQQHVLSILNRAYIARVSNIKLSIHLLDITSQWNCCVGFHGHRLKKTEYHQLKKLWIMNISLQIMTDTPRCDVQKPLLLLYHIANISDDSLPHLLITKSCAANMVCSL